MQESTCSCIAGEQMRAWQGKILSLVKQVGVLFERSLLQREHENEGEEEESSHGLVFTWGNSEEAAELLKVPAPSSACSACSTMAGRKELWHRAETWAGPLSAK